MTMWTLGLIALAAFTLAALALLGDQSNPADVLDRIGYLQVMGAVLTIAVLCTTKRGKERPVPWAAALLVAAYGLGISSTLYEFLPDWSYMPTFVLAAAMGYIASDILKSLCSDSTKLHAPLWGSGALIVALFASIFLTREVAGENAEVDALLIPGLAFLLAIALGWRRGKNGVMPGRSSR